MKPINLLTLVLCGAVLVSCAGHNAPSSAKDMPPVRTSPLGIDQPDPQALADAAVAAFERGDKWAFLSHFAFIDTEDGHYFAAAPEEGNPFVDAHLSELKPLAQSLFPLMHSPMSQVVFGRPRTVRNRPLTVEVPFTVHYDPEALTTAQKEALLNKVNHSLRRQGAPEVSFAEYAQSLQNMPGEGGHRFIYWQKRWYVDGASWRPFRPKNP